MTVTESMRGDPAIVMKKRDEVGKRTEAVNKQWDVYAVTQTFCCETIFNGT
jgi:hypothetical protein